MSRMNKKSRPKKKPLEIKVAPLAIMSADYDTFTRDMNKQMAEILGLRAGKTDSLMHDMLYRGGYVSKAEKIPFPMLGERRHVLPSPLSDGLKIITETTFTNPDKLGICDYKHPTHPDFVQMVDDIDRVEMTRATYFFEEIPRIKKRIAAKIRADLDKAMLNAIYRGSLT